ncbi:hypothetical protein [Lentzea tibetensis]|uniref:hypothetical protein n=1 Tax=Lentzea tibetensis TaxID=2591470 RepID=UPI0016488F54|nr:hypothetical protein [Lentzea tibetensis]
MKEDVEPAAAEPSGPPAAAQRSRRWRVAELFNSTALLATTALIIAIEPKNPPFKGD